MADWKETVTDIGDKTIRWFKAFYQGEEQLGIAAADESLNETFDSVLEENYEIKFEDVLRRNAAFQDLMSAFHVALAEEGSKMAQLREESRELLHWAFQQRESADKFREHRRRDFISVLESMVEHLAGKVEVLAAEKDWLLGKQSENDTIRDAMMQVRSETLRNVLKEMQTQFFDKVKELGVESYVESQQNKKVSGNKALQGKRQPEAPKKHEKLLEDFWKHLNLVNDVIADGETRLATLTAIDSQLTSDVDHQRKRLSLLHQQMHVFLLRFVSESDFNSAEFQLQIVELLNEIRRLSLMVEHLQGEIITVKNARLGVEVGLEVLRTEDVELGHAVTELGKYLRFIEVIKIA